MGRSKVEKGERFFLSKRDIAAGYKVFDLGSMIDVFKDDKCICKIHLKEATK